MKTEAQKERDSLIKRVKRAKKLIKSQNSKDAKNKFFDTCYGALYKSESTKLDNLWGGKIVDAEFTDNLEKFAVDPNNFPEDHAQIERFMKFVSWYTRTVGGKSLTKEEIQAVYPKFKI